MSSLLCPPNWIFSVRLSEIEEKVNLEISYPTHQHQTNLFFLAPFDVFWASIFFAFSDKTLFSPNHSFIQNPVPPSTRRSPWKMLKQVRMRACIQLTFPCSKASLGELTLSSFDVFLLLLLLLKLCIQQSFWKLKRKKGKGYLKKKCKKHSFYDRRRERESMLFLFYVSWGLIFPFPWRKLKRIVVFLLAKVPSSYSLPKRFFAFSLSWKIPTTSWI